MVDGGQSMLAGELVTPPPASPPVIDWRGSAFRSHQPAVSPVATDPREQISIRTGLGTREYGSDWLSPRLFEVSGPALAGDGSVTPSYGNPFPADWAQSIQVRVDWEVGLDPRDGSGFWHLSGGLGLRRILEEGQDSLIVQPEISPILDLRVDDHPAHQPVRGISLTPQVAFLPPAVGRANVYFVEVYQLRRDPDGLRWASYQGSFVTDRTDLRLPPGLLVPGIWSVLVVTAVSDEAYTRRTPWRRSPNNGYADTVSAPFLP